MATLAERMLAQRQHWVDLGEGKRVRIVRPRETEMAALVRGVQADHVVQFVDGWDGFTEADLLGPAVGSADPVPFDSAVWSEYVRDRVQVLSTVANAIADQITKHLGAQADLAKN